MREKIKRNFKRKTCIFLNKIYIILTFEFTYLVKARRPYDDCK